MTDNYQHLFTSLSWCSWRRDHSDSVFTWRPLLFITYTHTLNSIDSLIQWNVSNLATFFCPIEFCIFCFFRIVFYRNYKTNCEVFFWIALCSVISVYSFLLWIFWIILVSLSFFCFYKHCNRYPAIFLLMVSSVFGVKASFKWMD